MSMVKYLLRWEGVTTMFFCTPGQQLRDFSDGEGAEELQVRKGWVAGKMKVQRVVSKCMQTENWRQEKKVWRSRRSASAANVRFNLVWEQNCVSRKMRGQIYTGRCQSGHRTCFTQKMYSCLHMQNICCSGSKYFAGSRLFCRNIVTFWTPVFELPPRLDIFVWVCSLPVSCTSDSQVYWTLCQSTQKVMGRQEHFKIRSLKNVELGI